MASWNVNGIKARAHRLEPWIEFREPDVLGLQELRSAAKAFPMKPFAALGYEIAHFEHVAIVSRQGMEDVTDLLGDGRAVAATTEVGRFISVYVPNGQKAGTPKHAAKLKWLRKFVKVVKAEIETYGDVVIGADMNIARDLLDVWAPEKYGSRNLFTPAERKIMADLLKLGLTDIFREAYGDVAGVYSWWNYAHDSFNRNRGWRLDYILATADVATYAEHAIVDVVERSEASTSDHAPLWVDFRY